MIDNDGALRLAGAIARQWLQDEPSELPHVARWLGLDPGALRRGLGLGNCEECGGALVQRAAGPARRFCSACAAKRRNAVIERGRKRREAREPIG